MDNGYILFNAEGKKPRAMLTAFKDDDGTIEVFTEGTTEEVILLYNSIIASLLKCNIGTDALNFSIKAVEAVGVEQANNLVKRAFLEAAQEE